MGLPFVAIASPVPWHETFPHTTGTYSFN